ncbi:MAG: PIG-L family deacetylase [Phycisphaerales bacterium]|nr:MAG: PIG-L family deacetylase [Phycisphaerales bacterium]
MVIVAHPDDETLWSGGTMLLHPQARWTVVVLCRRSDPDRAPKFFRSLEQLGASGVIGDLDDGPDQNPLPGHLVRRAVLDLLPADRFDLIITHGIQGEYTYHLRHEEVGNAVMDLLEHGTLRARRVWRFAYEDGDGQYLPKTQDDADLVVELPEAIWTKKRDIITGIYGFAPDSFEAKTTPLKEAFWRITSTAR